MPATPTAQTVIDLNIASKLPDLTEITETFGLFDDWEDRYRYLIDLGKDLAEFPAPFRSDEFLVRGCQSQVWLLTGYAAQPQRLHIAIDSDAHIVRGLAAILIAAQSGKRPEELARYEPELLFEELGLLGHLSPSRGNGLRSMIARIKEIVNDITGCCDHAPQPSGLPPG